MLILHPKEVTFGNVRWNRVTTVVVDSVAARRVIEFGDQGPYPSFVDVPERVTTIRVMMDLADEVLSAPELGAMAVLTLHTAPTGVNASRSRVLANAVVVGVTHEISPRKGAVRTVELVAVSTGGVIDPVSVEDAGGTP